MDNDLDTLVFRYIAQHAPIAAVVIAAALGLDIETVERTLGVLMRRGVIGIAGHAPHGQALYCPLD